MKQEYSKTTGRDGDIGEMMVMLHYLTLGYEVFPNAGCTGPVDLVIINKKTDEVHFIDVKSKEYIPRNKDGEYTNWTVQPTAAQERLNVKFVYVERSTGRIREGF